VLPATIGVTIVMGDRTEGLREWQMAAPFPLRTQWEWKTIVALLSIAGIAILLGAGPLAMIETRALGTIKERLFENGMFLFIALFSGAISIYAASLCRTTINALSCASAFILASAWLFDLSAYVFRHQLTTDIVRWLTLLFVILIAGRFGFQNFRRLKTAGESVVQLMRFTATLFVAAALLGILALGSIKYLRMTAEPIEGVVASEIQKDF
jgi:hypothetical protein